MSTERPKALVTAAVSGPGLDLLDQLADLVLDSWLDQPSLRIYNAQQLAARVAEEGANIVVVESDVCGADLYEQPIMAVASCRGDPNNVDVPAATAAGVPVLFAPGRNADAVAEIAIALLFAATRGVVPADKDVREGEIYRDGKIPYQRYRAWSAWVPSGGPCAGAFVAWAWTYWPTTPTPPTPPPPWTSCSSAPM
jgi:D-3-phosphoglycerate dehydrogenase